MVYSQRCCVFACQRVACMQQQYVFIHDCIKHVLDERNREITMKQNGDVGMKLGLLILIFYYIPILLPVGSGGRRTQLSNKQGDRSAIHYLHSTLINMCNYSCSRNFLKC